MQRRLWERSRRFTFPEVTPWLFRAGELSPAPRGLQSEVRSRYGPGVTRSIRAGLRGLPHQQEALEQTPPSASTASPDGKASTLEFARSEDAKLIEFSAMRTSHHW